MFKQIKLKNINMYIESIIKSNTYMSSKCIEDTTSNIYIKEKLCKFRILRLDMWYKHHRMDSVKFWVNKK